MTETPAPTAEDQTGTWQPTVGDRVTVHYADGDVDIVANGTPATVTNVFDWIKRAAVTVDRLVDDQDDAAMRTDWHCDWSELRPITTDQPPTIALLLKDELADAYATWLSTSPTVDDRPMEDVALDIVRARLAQYQGSTPVVEVFSDFFGGAS